MVLHLGPLQTDSKEVWVDGLGADGLGGGADAPGKILMELIMRLNNAITTKASLA